MSGRVTCHRLVIPITIGSALITPSNFRSALSIFGNSTKRAKGAQRLQRCPPRCQPLRLLILNTMTGPRIQSVAVFPKSSPSKCTESTLVLRLSFDYSDADIDLLPLSDPNSWYYPSHGYTSDEEEVHAGMKRGNWGNKTTRGSRWLRRGKLAVWGPPMEDWEVVVDF